MGGTPYFLRPGEPIEIWDFVYRLLAAAELPPIRATIHPSVAKGVASLFETDHATLCGHRAQRMNRWILRERSTSRWFELSAARLDLGYKPTTRSLIGACGG
ncbi:MAG: hypothetical protein V3V08_08170 [Nannocystaceae bacterium]